MSLVLVDATSSSLTVSWPATAGASGYVLQYRKAIDTDSDEDKFETLSNKLTTTQAKKKNLAEEDGNRIGFFFRARALVGDDSSPPIWITHPDPFRLLTADEEKTRMDAPRTALAGSHEALAISWKTREGQGSSPTDGDGGGYELQMRENVGGDPWKTIAPNLSGAEVRKKNLPSRNGYQFRVRPTTAGGNAVPFSAPSDAAVSLGLSDGMKRLFGSLENGTLLRKANEPPVPLAEALGGKEFVLLYASASWCGPCRQFTPNLIRWYGSLGVHRIVEVVFLSADRDGASFGGYYGHMPWLAVDHDDDAREQLMSHIRVASIPRLVVLDGRTGRILEDNVVGKPMDVTRWRRLAAGNKS